ncbi:MAG: hypothetical protein ABI742_05520 [Gemmatimonadota bacterium]
MNDCESIQERIPLVAHGAAEWSEAEAAHLASCPDCSAEWCLIQTARRVGDAAAGHVNPTRVNQAVLARLAAGRRAARWKTRGWIAGLAAAAAVILMVQVGNHRAGRAPDVPAAATAAFHVPLAELEQLDASQLESVLEGLDEPLGSHAAPDSPYLGDLNDHQLERVLRSLEG